ncbi:mitochondrial 37S ribosomal protein nam9 [Allomyces arbusculus]|nr:mitochondrial 37S ribosomal protein nam9 [Allomyces arbusculus]
MKVRPNRFSVTRGLLRMSWNKKNLYNLASRNFYPDLARRTLFQQMWQAKKEIRAYHGGNITERQFVSTWQSEPLPVYGDTFKPAQGEENTRGRRKLPPMQALTFAPLERRLDVALFRSTFAPSVYAARQMVSHGKVMVNGKKCKQPSYLLKDGDMYTVAPTAIAMLSIRSATSASEGTDGEAKAEPTPDEALLIEKVGKKMGQSGPAPLKFTPRPFQAPWMFIPEYLEVNFNTCSGVFVRSPMVKPGKCEIPSPFPPEVHGLAHEYYSKRV